MAFVCKYPQKKLKKCKGYSDHNLDKATKTRSKPQSCSTESKKSHISQRNLGQNYHIIACNIKVSSLQSQHHRLTLLTMIHKHSGPYNS